MSLVAFRRRRWASRQTSRVSIAAGRRPRRPGSRDDKGRGAGFQRNWDPRGDDVPVARAWHPPCGRSHGFAPRDCPVLPLDRESLLRRRTSSLTTYPVIGLFPSSESSPTRFPRGLLRTLPEPLGGQPARPYRSAIVDILRRRLGFSRFRRHPEAAVRGRFKRLGTDAARIAFRAVRPSSSLPSTGS